MHNPYRILFCLGIVGCVGAATDKDPDEECDTGQCSEDTDIPGPTYDEGCTTVDGTGGYLWLNDAIEVANEGSEIFLCASDSGHEEEVIVDKSVSIVGPGSENYVLVAPTNTVGFTVTADNVSISGVAVDSTRSGIEVQAAAGVQFDDIQVLASGNWGIKATDSSDTTVTNATLMANGYGGVQIDGGSATISSSDLSGNTGYGALATGGAILTLNDNTIDSTTPDEMGDGSDGIGVRAEDSSEAHLSGNQISGNALVNVWADSSDLSMSGDIVVGALYGIAGLNGQVDLSEVTITDSFLYGLLASSQEPVTVIGCTVSGDPDATQNVPDDEDGDGYAEWGGEEYGYSGTGLYLVSDEVTLTDTTIEGYNNAGVFIAPFDSGSATVSNVQINDIGRHGIYFVAADAIVTDTSVTNLRQVEEQGENECLTVDRYAAITNLEGNLEWSGGELTNNEGYGISNVRGSLNASNTTFSNNNCAGVMNFGGTDILTGNTFSQTKPGQLSAAVVEYGNSGSLIDGNTFTNNQNTGEFVVVYDYSKYYDDKTCEANPYYCYTDTYTYLDKPEAVDIYLNVQSNSTISNNVFENGDFGIQSFGSELELSGNQWSGYRGTLLASSYGYNSDYTEQIQGEVEFSENTILGYGGHAIECDYSTFELSDSAFTGGGPYSYSYTLERVYPDDSGISDWVYEYSTETIGAVVHGNGCTLLMDDIAVNDLDGNLLTTYSYNWPGSYELIDIQASNISQNSGSNSAIYGYGYYEDTQIWLQDVNINGTGYGDGLEITPYDYSSYTATFALNLNNVQITDASDNGITLSTTRTEANIESTTIQGSGGYGIYAADSWLNLSDSLISMNGMSGIYIENTSGEINGTESSYNADYGWICLNAVLDSCTDNTQTENEDGATSGCEETCP